MNKKDIGIVSSGILTLLVTILLSLSWTEEWSGLTKWAFGIMLYSEISFFLRVLLLREISKQTISDLEFVLPFALMVMRVLVCILCMAVFKKAIAFFVIAQIVLHIFDSLTSFLTGWADISPEGEQGPIE